MGGIGIEREREREKGCAARLRVERFERVISCNGAVHTLSVSTQGRLVETLRSSDQIGSTERVRSIGSTATAQIHGVDHEIFRGRNPGPRLPPPPSSRAPRSVLYFRRNAGSRWPALRQPTVRIISSRLARIKVLPREEDFGMDHGAETVTAGAWLYPLKYELLL